MSQQLSLTKTTNKGFTLIELVVVIVILGILAATAAPKFINLQGDAKTSTLEGVSAAMKSAADLVHAKSIAIGNHNDPQADISVEGEVISIAYGYPISKDGNTSSAIKTWVNLLDLSAGDFRILTTNNGSVVIYPTTNLPADINDIDDIDDPCMAHYTEATGLNDNQSISFGVNDCE